LILVEKLDTKPTTTPRIMDAQGGMKPDAGVAATRPEMQPEHWKGSVRKLREARDTYPADHRPLSRETIIERYPSDGRKHCCQT